MERFITFWNKLNIMAAFNPVKRFDRTPKEFSTTSKVTGLEKEDYYRGIIFDSPEEFASALLVYDGGEIADARATQNNLLEAVGESNGAMGVGLLLLGGHRSSQGFTERLAQEAIFELRSSGRFHRSFDYDAMGSNFFKTTVEGNKFGEKYVLELHAAYVGDRPAKELAEKLKRPMALTQAVAKAKLSPVDTWWFNVNLEEVLKDLPITKDQIVQLAQHIGHEEGQPSWERPESPNLTFEYNGRQFKLAVGLGNVSTYLNPESNEDYSYLQARGRHLVGPSWTPYNEEGTAKGDARVINPTLNLSVAFPGKSPSMYFLTTPAVTESEMASLRAARDYIAGKVMPKQ